MNNYILDFRKFLIDNKVKENIVTTVLSFKAQNLIESIITNVILPIIERDADGDGKADIKDLEDYTYKIWGITFKFGSFIIALIRYFIIVLLIYLFHKYVNF